VCRHLSVARVAVALAVSWDTANDAVLAQGRRVLIGDPACFYAVAVIGVDEHRWRHMRRGDKLVTVIVEITPVREQTGPARLGALSSQGKDELSPESTRDTRDIATRLLRGPTKVASPLLAFMQVSKVG
jgi:hypothetical protein